MAEDPKQEGALQLATQLLRTLSMSELPKSVPQSPAEIPHKEREEVDGDLWPDSLCEGEHIRLAEMGMGKAVDSTQKQQWEKKTTYQAKEITGIGDLVVITEGFHKKEFADDVESFHELQANIGASVTISNMPIQIGVAADAQRSFSSSQHMSGTTIITRTIAFKTSHSHSSQVNPEKRTAFETDLEHWLGRKGCCTDEEGKLTYGDNSSHECLMFLRALGGVTHYISSITLGAMEYLTKTIRSTTTVTSSSASVGMKGTASAESGSKFTKKSSGKHKQHSEIGRIPDKGRMIKPRSTAEAVIRFSVSPLTNLVANDDLKVHLESAIKQYVEMNSFKRRGPFNIVAAEPTSENKRVFWQVVKKPHGKAKVKGTYKVVGTTNCKWATKFFIRPDDTYENGEMFYITTDPDQAFAEAKDESSAGEVRRMSLASASQHTVERERLLTIPKEETQSDERETSAEDITAQSQNTACDEVSTGEPDKSVSGVDPASAEKITSQEGRKASNVERYLHVNQLYGGGYTLRACSIVDRKKAHYKLIDRVSHKVVPIKRSSWLPEPDSALVGDPYLIAPVFAPGHYLHRPVITMAKDRNRLRDLREGIQDRVPLPNRLRQNTTDNEQDYFHVDLKRKSDESHLRFHLMLFALENSA